MKAKTNELIEIALDWAVAKCKNFEIEINDDRVTVRYYNSEPWRVFQPSLFWSDGGLIIEWEGIAIDCVRCNGRVGSWVAALPSGEEAIYGEGPTPLIAAMRCYVASKLGEEIELPGYLTMSNHV